MQKTALVFAAATLCACAGAPERDPAQSDVETHLTPAVVAIADAEGGVVDTDEHTNVRCKRIKIVGTHLHKRLCYTTQEEEELTRRHADEYYRRFGGNNRCVGGRCAGGN